MLAYLDPRILRIFILGVASGFPWVLIGSMLTLWLKDAGLSRTEIAYAGAIFAVYSINFLWAPLLDRYRSPLTFWLDKRKSWIISSQLLMGVACLLVSMTNPQIDAQHTVLFCLLIALFSATQDIAIDAYRIDSIPESRTDLIPIAASMATAGWWTGFSGLGALFLSLHDGGFLQSIHLAWPTLYRLAFYFMAAFVVMVMFFPKKAASEQALSDTSRSQNASLKQSKQSKLENMDDTYWQLAQQAKPAIRFLAITLTLIPCVILIWLLFGAPSLAESLKQHALFVPGLFAIAVTPLILAIYVLSHPSNQLSLKQTSTSISSKSEQGLPNLLNDFSLRFSIYILNTLGKPFASFFQRCGLSLAIKILLFIFCFKIGEAFLGRMSVLFYKELGFSTTEIATYSKLLSWWVTIIVSLVGGWFTLHFGMVKGLVIAGIAMASSNCFFSVMAIVGPEKWIFVTTVIIDGITSAWSNVAFVAFISLLVDRNYSASQYALFASIGTMSRTVLSSASGSWVDALDGNWALFFIITALMVIPALFLLYLISRNASLQQALTTNQVSTTHRPAPND